MTNDEEFLAEQARREACGTEGRPVSTNIDRPLEPGDEEDEGDMKITVADIVAFLQTLPQDAAAWPNEDGWRFEETKAKTVREAIERRGLFNFNPIWGLCIQ